MNQKNKNYKEEQKSPFNNGAGTRSVTGGSLRTQEKGITLIALIITIIVMLILVSVTISMAVNGGLFDYAGKASGDTNNAIKEEQQLANGGIEVDGTWYDSIDDYLGDIPSDSKRKLKVEYSVSEGQDLWASTVTLNISIEEDTPFTLEQKRALVPYIFDFGTYDNFKIVLSQIMGATDGTSALYDERILNTEEEIRILDYLIETGKNMLNFNDIDKLESLGIKVISVETPYETTLFTTSLGGEVKCTFVKNGTYTFNIKSGATNINQDIEVSNVRNYNHEGEYEVNVALAEEGKLEVSIDGSEDWAALSNTVLKSKSSIMFRFSEDTGQWQGADFIELNENFYKYYNSFEECASWYVLWGTNCCPMPVVLAVLAEDAGVTVRQMICLALVTEPDKYGDIFSVISKEQIEVAEIVLRTSEYYPKEALERYPQYYRYNKDFTDGSTFTLDLNKDMNVGIIFDRWP